MNFRIYASLYGGSVGIALALIARLARTLRYEQAEHLPLEFGTFVAASGFLSGALIAFLATWVSKDGLRHQYSWVRFLLVIIGFGIFTGFIRGILNPISVSASLPQGSENFITSIIGQGVATEYNTALGWIGSLDEFTPGSGYWFKSNSSLCFEYECVAN